MYFTILIGAMNLLRWVLCAANCGLSAHATPAGNQ